MFSSSQEYLQALRKGKYLLFLEWPQFIAKFYKTKHTDQDADEIVSLLVFDWLNNGYCVEDAKLIAVLYRVSELEPKLFRGNLDYAVVTILIATFQCMVYDRHHLINHYRCEDKKNKTQITQLMMSNNILLEKKLFESSLEKEQATFFLWAKDIENDELVKVVYLVTDIVNLRYCIEDYVNTLERAELPLDELKSTRLSVIKRLNNYLAEQTELTDAVKKQIANYVTLIREMQPALCEKQFLNIMSPPPLMDTIWPIVTSMGITFFNLIQAPVEDPSSLDSTTTKSSTQIPSPNYYPKSSLDKA